MANTSLTMEISDSGEPAEANEFLLESYMLGTDAAFPEEMRTEALGEKAFSISMSAKVVEFHRLTGLSLTGASLSKVWLRSYAVEEDGSRTRTAEFTFENARPIGFQLKSDFKGLSGLVTFAYSKAEAAQF